MRPEAEHRTNYMMRLYKRLNPEEEVTPQTKINNATIEKLCEFNGGGYQRVITWLLEKNKEKEKEEEYAKDYEDMKNFFNKCLALYKERNEKYGKSWEVLTAHTTANLIEMKAHRAKEMGEANAKSLDEAYDMANYAAMLHIILNRNIYD